MPHPTHKRDGSLIHPTHAVGYGWETVPEIAARIGHAQAVAAITAGLANGTVQGRSFDCGRGYHVPMFCLRLPLLGERGAA